MIRTANRLHTVEEYYFSKKLREVRGLMAQGKPIINMGIGSQIWHLPKKSLRRYKMPFGKMGHINTRVTKVCPNLERQWRAFTSNVFR